jgi:Fe-S-cluster-containing dehydrogenase component
MADRKCHLCGEFYTDETGHDYNKCVESCETQAQLADENVTKAIQHRIDAIQHRNESRRIALQDWWKREAKTP